MNNYGFPIRSSGAPKNLGLNRQHHSSLNPIPLYNRIKKLRLTRDSSIREQHYHQDILDGLLPDQANSSEITKFIRGESFNLKYLSQEINQTNDPAKIEGFIYGIINDFQNSILHDGRDSLNLPNELFKQIMHTDHQSLAPKQRSEFNKQFNGENFDNGQKNQQMLTLAKFIYNSSPNITLTNLDYRVDRRQARHGWNDI